MILSSGLMLLKEKLGLANSARPRGVDGLPVWSVVLITVVSAS